MILWIGLLLSTIFTSTSYAAHAQQKSKRPNFLLIVADDLGVMDLGVEGSKFYETPRIDRLANQGMRFTRGYAGCQVCSPSRASIMLGQSPARHGITDYIGAKTGLDWKRNGRILPAEYKRELPADETTLAEALRSNGYRTFYAGKWHLGSEGSHPEDHGFDVNVGGHRAGTPPGGYFVPYKNPKMKDGPPGESLPLRLGQETADFIRKQTESNPQQPFFAMLAFYSVHGPIQTTQPLWQKYRERAQQQDLAADTKRFQFDRTMPVRQVQDNPIYGGMMQAMDESVGIALDALKELNIDDNTVVVFTSDNGGVSSGDAFSTACLPLRGGKGRQWEGGIRAPFYVVAPGMTPAGSTCDLSVSGIDFFPTFLDLAGIDAMPRQHVDGSSLVPLLEGKTDYESTSNFVNRDLVWHYPHYGNQGGEPSSILRHGPWKLIHYWEDGRDELYNIVEDIGEQRDLAKSDPARAEELRSRLDYFLQQSGATIPQQDQRYSQKKRDESVRRNQTVRIDQLNKQHERFLKPDFRPNKNWWGSGD
ncbi:MAG: sulfatase [Planctomycetota bacterium]